MRTALLYVLHSGNLYGTEKMALATAAGVSDEFEPWIFAPIGRALEEAERLGMHAIAFSGAGDLAGKLRPYFASNRRLTFVATGVVHSLICVAFATLRREPLPHLHVIHGGADERLSYGRKRILNHFNIRFVAVSNFVRERLIANGVRADRITVIENFLPLGEEQRCMRPRFISPGINRAVVVSRVDPQKRVDLLLDALDADPSLERLEVEVLGTGYDLDKLRTRAAGSHHHVSFPGYITNVRERLVNSDLLVHLCPEEPFGLAILEAMEAGVPVLVPDSGGAGDLVDEGISGFRFRANQALVLAERLCELSRISPTKLNAVVSGGRRALATRFCPAARIADYRRLLRGAPA